MSLVNTRLQNWRVSNPLFDKNMARKQEYGALDFFVSQTDAANSILTPELKERAFASMGNQLQIPVIDYDSSVTVSNSRSCTISDDENTSALYTVVFTTYAAGFTMVPAMYSNNEISYQQDFNRKMEKVARAMAQAMDVDAVSALEAAKTQVFADLLQYQTVGNVVTAPKQMATEIVGDIDSLMRANAYPSQLHIVGNAGVDSLLRKLAEHGLYNDVNKQLEYAGKIFHFTNNVANGAGYNGTFFAVEDGNVGILTRVDREAYNNASTGDHEWGTTFIPYIGKEVGYHYYLSVGDQSSIAGAATADLTCGRKEHYGFSVDVAYVIAYNNDLSTIANPIIKAQIAAPAINQPYGMPVYVNNLNEAASIVLNKTATTIANGSTETLTATTAPNAYVVTWASSDNTKATVDSAGKVTGVAAGSANITASITVYGVTYTATCAVTVS